MRAEHRCGNQLRDPLAALHLERLVAEVGEDDLHLAAIVAVDRSRRVEAGDPMLQRKARAGANLDLMAVRDLDREAGRDGVPLARVQRQVLRRDDVEPGGMLGRIFAAAAVLRRAAGASA